MIGYVTLGTNDLPRATAYYDALFGAFDIGRYMEVDDYFVAWAPAPETPALSLTIPFDKKNASVGNGVMVALYMDTPEKVTAFYNKALELGGTDEGKPGFRPEEDNKGYYGAYFRDLDGNKLNAFCMVE